MPIPRVAALLALQAGTAAAAGFQFVEVPPAGGRAGIDAAVWYPSEAAPPEAANTPFGQAVAMHAPVAGDRLPLVVISHGAGGWFGGHATLARHLAESGMVVAALNHPGDSDGDETSPPGRWIAERPAQIARLVAHMTGDWQASGALDPDRIGLFGFSAGGHSVLVAAGARPSVPAMAAHCADSPEEFACEAGMVADVVARDPVFPDALQGVQAVVAVAPAFGFGFEAGGPQALGAPVQLWGAAADRRVPFASNLVPLSEGMPAATDLRRVENAGHFAFLQPCNPALQAANPRIWDMVCTDAPGFDRERFQQDFNAEVAAFLTRHLLP